jgi:threonine dehydratase
MTSAMTRPQDVPMPMPMPITERDVAEARHRIAPYIRRTPVLALEAGALEGVAGPITLKLELLQRSGSFKIRGAFHRIAAAVAAGDLPAAGVVAASGGNHGAAVALAARVLGIAARVFVPSSSPASKLARIRGYGAEVVVAGAVYAEARAAALAWSETSGALDIPAYDDPHVAAGQGTLALELVEDAAIDTLLVAIGGGGLAAGCAAALAPRGIRVVAVETQTTACFHAALAAGAPVDVDVSGVAVDSLGARRIGALPFAVLTAAGAISVIVPDPAVTAARAALWEGCRVAAEPGASTALAALVSGAYRPADGERVAVVVSGSNHPLAPM